MELPHRSTDGFVSPVTAVADPRAPSSNMRQHANEKIDSNRSAGKARASDVLLALALKPSLVWSAPRDANSGPQAGWRSARIARLGMKRKAPVWSRPTFVCRWQGGRSTPSSTLTNSLPGHRDAPLDRVVLRGQRNRALTRRLTCRARHQGATLRPPTHEVGARERAGFEHETPDALLGLKFAASRGTLFAKELQLKSFGCRGGLRQSWRVQPTPTGRGSPCAIPRFCSFPF
jgi:hypothetical protein